MKNSFITLFCIVLIFSVNIKAFAFVDLSEIKAPAELKNIYAKTLGSNKDATAVVLFIAKSVAPHYHAEHTELIYILEGEAILALDDTRQVIKAGHFIRVEPKVIHAVQVTSDIPLKVLSIQTPEFSGKDRIFVKKELYHN